MDPAKMKVVDLRSELGALGLDTKGNKPALVERLKKALEAKSGKAIADTTILDTSTEDVEDTPKRPGPAARTRRRSSSVRLVTTPAKQARRESPEPIAEVPDIKEEDRYSPGASSDEPDRIDNQNTSDLDEPMEEGSPSLVTSPVQEPVVKKSPAMAVPVEKSPVEKSPVKKTPEKKLQKVADNVAEPESDVAVKEEDAEPVAEKVTDEVDKDKEPEAENPETAEKDGESVNGEKKRDRRSRFEDRERELTEEEEWDLFNQRLLEKEKERVEREKKQAEDDAKKMEELADDPVKLKRLQRKVEKKQRWNNYYRNIEVTNEILRPPVEEDYAVINKKPHGGKGKKEAPPVEAKFVEPELDDSRITLSWFDSDLNQYLALPELNEVTPMNEGVFAHTWAGTRASHGVLSGRVCFEVKVGASVTSTESLEKDPVSAALRIGWSTDDQSLHLGDGERSWAYESSSRAVNNGEFKEYGKVFAEKDVIATYIDLESSPCRISYTLNGEELGVAFEFEKSALEGKPLFPHVLTKNMCYKVNMGHDKYTMMTKTKIVRNRLEIPVEQVLEEKRLREEELQRIKDEAERKEKERRDKEKREREERQRKKREEREKHLLEKREREAAEKRAKADAAGGDKDKDPKENGDKPAEPATDVKKEPEDVEMTPAAPEPPKEAPAPAEAEAAAPEAEAPPVKDEPAEVAAESEVPSEVTEEQVLGGHVLDKRIKFVIRYTADEELDGAEATLLPGYVLISRVELVAGPRRPASIAECEVILMVGMPGAGKTHWVKQRSAEYPEKRYNILSTGALFDKMKVDCKPFKASYEGRWDAMVSKCAKCVLKLLELAHGRHRNFILDQTNVYPSAQRRKLREFDGYRRIAVAVVTDEETYKERCQRRETTDGKEVPDPAIMDMKANFSLPEKCSWLEEVIYSDLGEEEAKKVIDAYHKEAKAAGVQREREKRERSAGRDAPAAKRQRSQDKRGGYGRDDRGRSRDQRDNRGGDRWGGGGDRWGNNNRGGGGNRWGGSGGGRDRSSSQNNRFGGDRPWNNQRGGGDGYGRGDRDNFRGGHGGRPPMFNHGHRALGAPAGPPPLPPPDRFSRERSNRGPPPADRDANKRPAHAQGPPPQGGGGGGGGGAGSWQRGGQIQSSRGGPGGNRGGGSNRGSHHNQKDGNPSHNQQGQQGWNQWAGGWGGWGGNWNQNQQQQQQQQQPAAGWNNWQNWQNWNQAGGQGAAGGQAASGAPAAASAQAGAGAAPAPGAKGQAAAQWPANYTAQQWYQWQQWQQQQQNWAGYQQQQQQGGATPATQATNAQDAQNAWAQYYQTYGNAAANAAGAASGNEKK